MKTKKEKLQEFNQKNILETAEKLFAEKGYLQTTMDDISKHAEYSKSTIYVYFKSKEDIYNHIIYTHMCQLKEAIIICIQESEHFEDCYYKICDSLVRFYEDYPLYFTSIMGNISIDQEELEINEILRKIYQVGEDINTNLILAFEKGVKEDYLDSDINILPTVFTLWASLGSVIAIANNKESYISQRMGMSKTEFLSHGFLMLLTSIMKG